MNKRLRKQLIMAGAILVGLVLVMAILSKVFG